jgi:hypothetical protein
MTLQAVPGAVVHRLTVFTLIYPYIGSNSKLEKGGKAPRNSRTGRRGKEKGGGAPVPSPGRTPGICYPRLSAPGIVELRIAGINEYR